jgi:hypothetical protein
MLSHFGQVTSHLPGCRGAVSTWKYFRMGFIISSLIGDLLCLPEHFSKRDFSNRL